MISICRHVLLNPFYPTGSVLARQATNGATALWAMLVLCIDDALTITAYHFVTDYVDENVLALVLLVISGAQAGMLCAKMQPKLWWPVGYAVQWVWWLGVLTLILQARPLQVTATMGVATVATLAAFAFVSGKRTGDRNAESD